MSQPLALLIDTISWEIAWEIVTGTDIFYHPHLLDGQ
jgi:hypothetical protein